MIEFVKSLGEGAFGSVELVRFTSRDGSNILYFAVKSSPTGQYESLSNEFQILYKLRNCPRIIQTFGTDLSRGVNDDGVRVYKMSMEYASAGSLASFMGSGTVPETMIKNFTRMILQGLMSVHSHGYVHCDLKPENLLVFPCEEYDETTRILKHSFELKISDFGMSTEAGKESKFWEVDDSPFLGTPLYMSPESVETGVAEKTLDLWSLGCVVLEMYTGEPPWPFLDSEELLPLLVTGNTPEIPQSVPSDARKFLETCFASKPVERGSALELLKHPFLQKVSGEKTVNVIVGEAKTVVLNSENFTIKPKRIKILPPKPLKVKILPPKPPEFQETSNKPLKVRFLPPRPPKFKKTSNKPLKVRFLPPKSPDFKEITKKPLRLKIIPPKPLEAMEAMEAKEAT